MSEGRKGDKDDAVWVYIGMVKRALQPPDRSVTEQQLLTVRMSRDASHSGCDLLGVQHQRVLQFVP